VKSYRHDMSLNISLHSTVEDPEDHTPEFVIQAFEERLAKLKADKKNWREYVECFHSEEDES